MTPIYDTDSKTILFYTAARGHHRDIGGKGGMSGHPLCTYLEEEGAVIKSFKLVSKGIFDEEGNTHFPLLMCDVAMLMISFRSSANLYHQASPVSWLYRLQ